MKLKTLKTKNFKRLGTQEFSFTEGLNFILGGNGQGKSTLTRAIATALYGVQALPGLADDVATWGTNSWMLELGFEHEGVHYSVRRTKSSAKLESEEGTVAEGNLPVTEAVEKLIGLNARDYHLFIHSRQGETAYILSYGATALQRKVEEFSGVSEIEELQRKARDTGRQLQQEADSISVRKVEGITETYNRVKSIERSLSNISEMEAPVRPSEVSRKYRDSLRRAELIGTIRDLEDNIRNLAVVTKPQAPGNTADNIRELEEKRTKIYEYHLKAKNVFDELASIEPVVPLAEPEAVIVDENYSQELTLQLQRKRELEKQIKDGICSSCGTVLDSNKEDAEEELQEVKANIVVLQDIVDENDKKLREYQRALRSYENSLEKHKEYLKKVEDLQEKVKDYDEGLTWSQEDELESLKLDLREYSRQLELYSEYIERLKRWEGMITVHQEELKEIEETETTEQDVRKAEEEWEEYQINQLKIQALTSELSIHKTNLERLIKEKQEEEEKANRKDLLEGQAYKCDRLSKYLGERRQSYLLQVWDNILGKATDLLNYTTGGWITGVSIQEGKFLFEEKGAWIPAVEASGAQAAFIGTALRIAMNSVLYKGDSFMVFDEPTADMTEDNSLALVAGISEASEQLFVVTHRSSDQGLAGNVIEITS